MRAQPRRLVLFASLSLALLAPLVVASPAHAAHHDDYTFTIAAGEATITGYTGTDPHLDIPAAIVAGGTSYPVTTIGIAAFWVSSATSATVPDSVRTIEDYAFGMSSLTAVDLGNSVETIGAEAFARTQLTNVVIPDSTVTLHPYAFARNALTSVTLGEGLEQIGVGAFMQNNLGALRIPDSVTSIGNSAFTGAGITSLTLGSGLTTVGDSAFRDNAIPSVTLGDAVTDIGTYAFSVNELTEVHLGASVERIGYGAFMTNRITSLRLNAGLRDIGEYAFRGNELTTVTIPAGLATIGTWAFYANPLSSAIFEGDAPTTFVAGHLLGASSAAVIYHYPQAQGFDPVSAGSPVRIVGAATSQLALTALPGPGATHRASVEVRDDQGDPVAGVPVRFTFPAGTSAVSTNCTTDAVGQCGVDASFPAGLSPASRAQIGADANQLAVGDFPASPAATPSELAATGAQGGWLAGIALALLATGTALMRTRRKRVRSA